MRIEIPVSPADLLDRLSILDIKYRRGLVSVEEVEEIEQILRAAALPDAYWFLGRLDAINSAIFDLEELPFSCDTARKIRSLNRKRYETKAEIDEAYSSDRRETKSEAWTAST